MFSFAVCMLAERDHDPATRVCQDLTVIQEPAQSTKSSKAAERLSSELSTLSLTCCCAEACAIGTLIEGPTLAWCRATKTAPAAPPPGLVLPSSSGCSPSLLTSAKPKSSSGSARCPRDMFRRAGAAAKPCLAADCSPGCWESPAASTACPGALEVDWRLRRPSSAEAIGAVKAVGGGTAGAAGALPAQQLLQGCCIGPEAGGVLACEGQLKGMGIARQMEVWPAGGWVSCVAVRWYLDAGMLSSGALSSASWAWRCATHLSSRRGRHCKLFHNAVSARQQVWAHLWLLQVFRLRAWRQLCHLCRWPQPAAAVRWGSGFCGCPHLPHLVSRAALPLGLGCYGTTG